jgi:hypothetical protein
LKGDLKGGATADKPKAPDKKTKDAARKAYGEGEKKYASGEYAAAYENFSKAFELIPSPHASYWMAKSLDQQGKADEAIKGYEAFLADPESAKAGEDKVADAQARMTDLKSKQIGEINLATVPAGATVIVDGNPQMGETPLTLKLPPGQHKVTLNYAGFETKDVDLEVKGGEKSDQKIELSPKPVPPPPPPVEAAPPPPPPPPPPPEKRSKVPAYVTLGIAAGGAIVGTIFGIQALSAKGDFEDKATNKSADDTERNALIADMAFGVALTLGVTGIVLLTSDDDDTSKTGSVQKMRKLPARAKLNVAPYASPTGGGAAARLTF